MRFRIPNTVCLLLLLVLELLSCKKDNSSGVTRPLNLPPGSDAVINASNQFAFKFFNTVLQQDPALNNKLVSPLSVYTALSMLYNGAANATRDSIARTLQLNGISIDDLYEPFGPDVPCQRHLFQWRLEICLQTQPHTYRRL